MSVATLTARGYSLYIEITARQSELDDIEKKLKEHALKGEQIDLQDADREGKQFLAQARTEDGLLTVPVVITADLTTKSFEDGGKTHQQLTLLGGQQLSAFFRRTVTFKSLFDSGKELRAVAAERLGDRAPAFLAALVVKDKHGIPKNQIKVDWNRATHEDAK